MSVTVLIPIYNEELHLDSCLASVVDWADRVVVIDSFSNDRSEAIVSRFQQEHGNVEWVQHAYEGPADQKNWALDHLDIQTEWVLFLDADESVMPELAQEIGALTDSSKQSHAGGEPQPNGYFLNRRIIWYGKWIRHGGWFPNWNLRLFRFGKARYEQRRVHEHMVVDGSTGRLKGHLWHEDVRDLTHSIAKHNRYSNLEAQEYTVVRTGERDDYARFWTRDPLARRRFIKTRIWAHLPAKPIWYFTWAYFVRGGFLDGWLGLRYHALHAVFKFFDELKVWELERKAAVRATGPDMIAVAQALSSVDVPLASNSQVELSDVNHGREAAALLEQQDAALPAVQVPAKEDLASKS